VWRAVTSYLIALPATIGAAGGLYVGFGALRRSNWLLRFVARCGIIGGTYTVFGLVMRVVGGPCIFSGPTRGGGYDSSPTNGRGIVLIGLIIGLLGAALWPFVPQGRKRNIDM